MTYHDHISERDELLPMARLRPLIFLVAGAMFMEYLDATIITTALPAMAKSFGERATDLSIGISAYMVALGIFIPPSGWVADRYGARRTFTSAIMLFTTASALCGMAQTLEQFVSMRVVQGVAGAMMVPVGRLVVLRHTPPSERTSTMATLIWPALAAPILGPPLGGFIATHASWRWIFYLNLPLGLIAFLIALRLVPRFGTVADRPFDWRGFLLCGMGTLLLLLGLERSVRRLDWIVLAALAGGVAFLIASLRHFHRSPAPMLDLRSYRIASVRASLRGGSCFRMALSSVGFLLPLMFQLGFGFSAEEAGLLMLGLFVVNLATKSVSTRLILRFGFRPILIWNGIACALAIAACATFAADTPVAVIIGVLMAGGATRSLQWSAMGILTFNDVPASEMSGANGLASSVVQLGMGAGVALGAVCIRAGHELATLAGMTSAAADFRGALILVALVALCGIPDFASLGTYSGARQRAAI